MIADDVPAPIAAAFAERPTLTAKELCRLLRMDPKVLREHCRAGNITFILPGIGERRPRREFALSDVMRFYQRRRREECLSTDRKARRSTGSTSGVAVIDFTDPRARPNVGPRRR